jgi:outer membrane lipoprotein SlyB
MTHTLRLQASLAIAAGLLSLPVLAADGAPAIKPSAKTLASVCNTCGVVTRVTTEQQKGKGSGLGAVGGALAGGLLGNQVGKGTGNTVATVGGAVAGGVAGNEVEKHMKKTTVWKTTVMKKDGSSRSYENTANPGFKAGDVVDVASGHPVKR